MSKFIKLRSILDDEVIYVNVEHIVVFYKGEKGTNVIIKLYIDMNIQRDGGYLVKESPEAIMSMIECY